MNNITAVVPTRKGSERVLSKNTRKFSDKSLLECKLEVLNKLRENGYIDEIVVNTDCEVSMKIANSYDARVVERTPYLATSDAPITDYWTEVLTNGIDTDHVMLCQCTSPLITVDTYVDAISKYEGNSLLSIEYIKDYLWKGDDPLNYEYPNHPKSQNLSKDFWKINFGVVVMSKREILKYENLKTPNTQLYPIGSQEGIDIDNMVEFKLAEIIFDETNEK